ncbi:BRCA1-associated ATM activator 1 isoform X1 [Rhinichthys klamathensis goyatoka]|uniref:BRCA1-associated ATM activator 1 isoform X1 n=1 Tax=Rhinichthys klamathensis goyatoka TaxID=3034132 RepID=UPI0024B5FC21|nr:BRCA1-associated ATM activator 1 isoform X1 [Rhinichthys klamathensis goyatoka]XP_056120535.1 BRCA1-associated ATM activator 1 isoform X1 [Rhinichthys klamathensis goyatoka]
MDSDCLSLLPAVCLVLADPKQSPPDDTSLEKLLDWFKELHSQSNEQVLLRNQPCLKEFISSVCTSKTTDPVILSFTLKLTGLLAGTKQGFHLLEEGGLLVSVFEREAWFVCDLWEDASVRSGWLQGLLNMLKHRQALDFICGNGLIKVILQLQNDGSLFVACLANQLLVHILNFLSSSNMTNGSDAMGSSESSFSSDWVSVSSEIMNGVVEALSSNDHPRVLQGLRLLSSVPSQCGEPIRSTLWKDVLVPLEVLINRGSESLTQPLMTVLQAAVRTPLLGQSEYKVEELLEAMLGSGSKNESFQCAALIIKLEKCPEVLKRKAIDIVLLPLQCVSAQSQDTAEKMNLALKEQLSQKASCISHLMQSLSSLEELAYTKYQFEGISIHSVTRSVVLLLRICSGHCPSSLIQNNASTHLIGCCKVQRCGLDTLGALSVYEENLNIRKDIFGVLLDYLKSPDSHATVLKKTYQATMSWIAVCSPFPDLLEFISHDLFPVLKKRMCDLRWEVRDSTLEFITQLTVALNGTSGFIEALHTSGMVSILLSSLADSEGYVRASAVAVVGEAVTSSLHQTVLVSNSNLLEEALTQMMTILSQDTEGFPRRAVVKAFTSWLKGSHLVTAVHPFLSSVLSLGCNDFDWEVKMHTLELAEVLMEKTLTCCPYAIQNFGSSEKTHLMQALSKLKEFGLFDLLFNSLFDCDRPVCERACALLLKLRTLTSESADFDSTLVLNVNGNRWGDEVQSRYLNPQQAKGSVCASDKRTDSDLHCIKDISLPMILHILDLDDMQRTLKLSSDHVVNSPRSLMEDILSAAQQSEDNMVDCY